MASSGTQITATVNALTSVKLAHLMSHGTLSRAPARHALRFHAPQVNSLTPIFADACAFQIAALKALSGTKSFASVKNAQTRTILAKETRFSTIISAPAHAQLPAWKHVIHYFRSLTLLSACAEILFSQRAILHAIIHSFRKILTQIVVVTAMLMQ